jgi:hypothetical protein
VRGGDLGTVDEGIEDVLAVTIDQIVDVTKDAAIEDIVSLNCGQNGGIGLGIGLAKCSPHDVMRGTSMTG